MSQLPVAIRQANELAEKANALSDKLKDIAFSAQLEQTAGGVDPFVFAVAIFTLACFVGYYVVWKVTPALHTPLMSITNAISGIIIIGALIASGSESFGISSVLGFIAVFLASINIFGGFIVTERMLGMFKRK
jgi:NAD(P) transhydrogenase subunit alpha